jgi:hypothetical protein
MHPATLPAQHFLEERAAKIKFAKEAQRRKQHAVIQQNDNIATGESLGSLLAKAELSTAASARELSIPAPFLFVWQILSYHSCLNSM